MYPLHVMCKQCVNYTIIIPFWHEPAHLLWCRECQGQDATAGVGEGRSASAGEPYDAPQASPDPAGSHWQPPRRWGQDGRTLLSPKPACTNTSQ